MGKTSDLGWKLNMISQDSQRREGPLLARQTGAVFHLASTPPLLCPASCTRLHGFSLCLIQVSFYKMLKMGLIVSRLVFALHTTCTDTRLPDPCHFFKLHLSGYLLFCEVQGQTPHLSIFPSPSPILLKVHVVTMDPVSPSAMPTTETLQLSML